jgi:NAD(P)H dehydrogenase (quinone)
MMSEKPIAVTGATGALGGRVASRLAAAGARRRLVVRDPRRLTTGEGAEVRAIGGYGDAGGVREALRGCGTLFLVPATEAADRVERHATLVDAAVAAGVERIVYVSFFGAAPDATFTFARDHWATEERIRATGVPFSFLRMNLYTDVLPVMVHADGAIRGPAGDGRVASVTRDDLAAAAVAVLTTEGHDGRTYDVTGPENLTLARAATQLSEASGRPIRFVDESDDEAYASRAIYNAADWEVAGWVTSYQAIRDGSLAGVRSSVRDLTGEEPRSLAEYLAAHPGCLDHVEGSMSGRRFG